MDWLSPELITTIVTVLAAILSAVFGSKFMKYKKAIQEIAKAFSDGELTADETRAIIRAFTGSALDKPVQEQNKG
jgi:hypothetical protein